MSTPDSIGAYLGLFATELGERILQSYPPLHRIEDGFSPLIHNLLRKPFPAQRLAIMGMVKRWELTRAAAVIAECGTGKTLISLGSIYVHSKGRPFTALVMVPPQLTEKWAREAFLTLPRVRVFLIDGLRDRNTSSPNGVHEVKLRHGCIVRDGFCTTLTDLRLRKTNRSPRDWWDTLCTVPSVFIVGRDRAKLGYFWRPAYQVPQSGSCQGIPVNADTGEPVYRGDERLMASDLARVRHSEVIGGIRANEGAGKARRSLFSPLWQADQTKIRRCAPIDFIGRYLQGFFDYGIADEVHELKGDTAQGNALGTLATCAKRVAVLTGTLLGGYADDLFNILFRLEPRSMVSEGFEWGEGGVRRFMETYGVLEKVAIIQPEENACSKARVTRQVRRRPGASPLLFGRFLMSLGAFVSLEDISEALPPYEEEVIGVSMDLVLAEAYAELEEAIKQALKEHRGNRSVLSIALNTLLLYPDRPFGLGSLTGFDYDLVTHRRDSFLIAETRDLATNCQYAKERRLLEEVKAEVAQGRRCQIYVVYTQKRDVTERLESILRREGIRVAVLRSKVPPEQRESWYERQVRQGTEVVICHPKLVQTGLDLIEFPTLIFYETGYSIFVLRQASRRSWRIGQKEPVKVKFLYYEDTVQASCLRLMGKKLLVSLAMEGKFANEGLQAMDGDDDLLMAMARELVQERGIGESADAIWKNLRKQQEEVFNIRSESGKSEGSHSSDLLETEIVHSDRTSSIEPGISGPMHQLALFGQCGVLSEGKRSRRVIRKTSCPQPSQQSLFESL